MSAQIPQLLTPVIASPSMRAILHERARLQRVLDFEVGLMRAQAAVGMLPALAIDSVSNAARAESFDLEALAEQAMATGNMVQPVIDALTAQVAKADGNAAAYVNWGASTQDVLDTALMLDLKAAIDALIADLGRAIDAFIALAGRHRRTVAVARIGLQHGLPIPVGLKLAGYAGALARSRDRLKRVRREALVLQLGGRAGTLAELHEHGLAVAERLAALLDLGLPEGPWHTHRDRLAEVASVFAILSGTCGKIARDIGLMLQIEIGEAFAARKADQSSACSAPPVVAHAITAALAAASMAPNLTATILSAQLQEHEAALGGWQVERATVPVLALVTSGALHAVLEIAEGLEIDAERARGNLGLTRGLIMAEGVSTALAAKRSKEEARQIVEDAAAKARSTRRNLQETLSEDQRVQQSLSVGELAKLFEPMSYQGVAQTFLDRIVAHVQGRAAKR